MLLFAGGGARAQTPADQLQKHFAEGQQAIVENRYADASRALEQALAIAPDIPELNATLGFSYFQQGRHRDAIPVLAKAVNLKPELPNVNVLLAASRSELGQFEQALPGLQAAFGKIQDPALNRLAGLQLQRCYTGLARHREAVETALEMTKHYPDDPEVLYHAGRLFGNYAFLAVQKLGAVAPDSVWTSQAAGEAYESSGQYERAISAYRDVLGRDPGRTGIHFRIGRALLRGPADTEAAMAEFRLELQADPSNANAAYEIGEVLRKQGEFAQARDYFTQAVKFYPEFEQAQLALGGVLTSLGDPAGAITHLRRAIALDAGNDVSYYRLAQAHRALGQIEEMRAALAKFQQLRQTQRQREAAGAANEPVTAQEVEDNTPG